MFSARLPRRHSSFVNSLTIAGIAVSPISLKRFDPALSANQVVVRPIVRGHVSSVHADRLLKTNRSDAGDNSFESHWFRDLGFRIGYLGNGYKCDRFSSCGLDLYACCHPYKKVQIVESVNVNRERVLIREEAGEQNINSRKNIVVKNGIILRRHPRRYGDIGCK